MLDGAVTSMKRPRVRARKPKVRTGCITCKSVVRSTVFRKITWPANKLDLTESGVSNVTNRNRNAIDAKEQAGNATATRLEILPKGILVSLLLTMTHHLVRLLPIVCPLIFLVIGTNVGAFTIFTAALLRSCRDTSIRISGIA